MAKAPKAKATKAGTAAKPARRGRLKGTAAKLEARKYGRGKITFYVAAAK